MNLMRPPGITHGGFQDHANPDRKPGQKATASGSHYVTVYPSSSY